MAHANNSEGRNGIEGMPFAGKFKVVDGQRQQLTTDKETRGMPNATKPKQIDGPRQQLKRQGDSGSAYCHQTQVC